MLLGREGCGKSSLVARFVQGTYTEQYDPHVVDVYKKEGNVGGAAVVFNVIDVCGSEDFSSIRNMECSKADARILCCDVSPESVAHAEELHETLNDSVGTQPCVLVATKCDSSASDPARQAAQAFADSAHLTFIDTSAKLSFGIDAAFAAAAQAAFPELAPTPTPSPTAPTTTPSPKDTTFAVTQVESECASSHSEEGDGDHGDVDPDTNPDTNANTMESLQLELSRATLAKASASASNISAVWERVEKGKEKGEGSRRDSAFSAATVSSLAVSLKGRTHGDDLAAGLGAAQCRAHTPLSPSFVSSLSASLSLRQQNALGGSNALAHSPSPSATSMRTSSATSLRRHNSGVHPTTTPADSNNIALLSGTSHISAENPSGIPERQLSSMSETPTFASGSGLGGNAQLLGAEGGGGGGGGGGGAAVTANKKHRSASLIMPDAAPQLLGKGGGGGAAPQSPGGGGLSSLLFSGGEYNELLGVAPVGKKEKEKEKGGGEREPAGLGVQTQVRLVGGGGTSMGGQAQRSEVESGGGGGGSLRQPLLRTAAPDAVLTDSGGGKGTVRFSQVGGTSLVCVYVLIFYGNEKMLDAYEALQKSNSDFFLHDFLPSPSTFWLRINTTPNLSLPSQISRVKQRVSVRTLPPLVPAGDGDGAEVEETHSERHTQPQPQPQPQPRPPAQTQKKNKKQKHASNHSTGSHPAAHSYTKATTQSSLQSVRMMPNPSFSDDTNNGVNFTPVLHRDKPSPVQYSLCQSPSPHSSAAPPSEDGSKCCCCCCC